MNCDGYYRNIAAYCEQELTPELRAEVEAHAAACPSCSEFHAKALEITCREIAELYEYVADTLPPDKRRIYERHFSICEACRNYLDSYRKTIRLAGAAGRADDEATKPVDEALVRSILNARRKRG